MQENISALKSLFGFDRNIENAMISDYKIISVLNKAADFPKRTKAVTRKFGNDRRRQKKDRRSSIRDGVIVNLSFESNKRKGTDRRKL